ncbi:MAG: aminofutalosine synthase MqnE [Actinobacteria bacterium]|nr:aminofutalosine synthase MqnE [Actinomycetota bacterium]
MGWPRVLEAPPLPSIRFRDRALVPVWDKVQAGGRLAEADGLACLRTWDLVGLGRMADWAARQRSSDRVYFTLNVHINPTNICVLACKFCDFAAKQGDPHAYEHTVEDILAQIHPDVHEVHIVGGHHPDWPFEHYEHLLRTIARERPRVQIKAFTAAEIDYFHKRWKLDEEEIFERLLAAGLHSMPGGGAEVFSERVRRALFPGKAGADRWIEIHHIAHGMGIRSNATMLYGHIETYAERIRHLARLREAQDETGGFLCFIPLEYQLGTTNLVPRPASPLEDLRTLATARLMLDNFPHVKAYWVMTGESTAAIGLNFGADDLDGTIGHERIAHAALAASPLGLTRDHMLRLIRSAGKVPVERDAAYRPVQVHAA